MTVRRTLDLRDALHGINTWYPATAQPPRTTTAQTRTAHASKTPIPADVLSARRDTLDKLTTWTRHVADHRGLHPDLYGGDVRALCRFLGDHAEWLASDIEGERATRQLAGCARTLEQIVKQSRPARVVLPGECPEDECPGRLVATVTRGDDLLPAAVRCDVAPREHVWEPHDWPALGRRVTRAAEEVA